MPMAVNPRGFGSGSSPILVGDHIILDMQLGADSHLLALRSQDGEPVWKTPKPRFNGGYSTPVVWREGADVVVGVLNSGRFTAYSAADGSERWWVTGLPVQTCATPVVADGMVYLNGTGALGEAENVHLPPTFDQAVAQYDSDKDGKVSSDEVPATLLFADRQSAGGAGDMTLRQALLFGSKEKSVTLDRAGWDKMVKDMTQFAQGALMKTSAVAVRCEGKGDVTATHVAWSQEKGVPEVPSPLLYRNRLYFVKNGGIVTCREPATGKTVFEQRLGAAGGYYASPVAADGRIYVASDVGAVTVFEAGDTLKVHARNDLREAIMATPAIIDGKLYIRTARQLFAFAE
jgi:outer membrane protein assembly factor BamB